MIKKKNIILSALFLCKLAGSSSFNHFGGGGFNDQNNYRSNNFDNENRNMNSFGNNRFEYREQQPVNNSFDFANRNSNFNFADRQTEVNAPQVNRPVYQQNNTDQNNYRVDNFNNENRNINSFNNNRFEYREQQPVNNSFDFANRNNNFNFANRQDSYFHQNQLLVQQNLPTQANTISQTSATNPVNTPSQTNPVNSSVAVNQSTVNNPTSITTPANTTNPTNPTNTVAPTNPVNTPSQTNPVNSSVAVNQSTVNNPTSITTPANTTNPTPPTNPTNPSAQVNQQITNALTANTYSVQDIQNANILLFNFLTYVGQTYFIPGATDQLGYALMNLVKNKQLNLLSVASVISSWAQGSYDDQVLGANYAMASTITPQVFMLTIANGACTPAMLLICETMAAQYMQEGGRNGWSLNWYQKLINNTQYPQGPTGMPAWGYLVNTNNIVLGNAIYPNGQPLMPGQPKLFFPSMQNYDFNAAHSGVLNYMQQGSDGNYYVVGGM